MFPLEKPPSHSGSYPEYSFYKPIILLILPSGCPHGYMESSVHQLFARNSDYLEDMVEAQHTKQLDEAQSIDEPLREPLSSLGVELTRISAEIQSIHSGFQVQLQQALGEVHSAREREYSRS